MKQYFHTFRNPISVILALLIIGGILTYAHMDKSLFPQITFPKIKIIADGGLQPASKMMVSVTKPLENAIKGIPNLQDLRSTTSRGSCEISAYMDWKTNIDLAKQQIESSINEIRTGLPPDVQITVEKMNPSTLPVMGYTLESKSHSPIELKQLALYTIKPYLSQVSGVAQVQVAGGETKEYWIELNQDKMSMLSITPAMVAGALNKTNFILANGYLADYHRLYLSVTDATVNNIQELGNVVITNNGKRLLKLKDIAVIKIHPAMEYVRINANGKPAVLIAVLKQPDANLIDVSQNVEKKINNLKNILPADVTVKPYYIQSGFVNDAVRSVGDALWVGILLAIIVAVFFLRSWKASLTLLIIIPISQGLTIVVLRAVGYTLNIMTLGALVAAIALIIDDAIVIVEQIHRTREEQPEEDNHTVVHRTIHYLFHAMMASSLSTIVIFIPFVLMSGLAGAYFKVLAYSMVITLVCSFFVTWLGLPVIYLLLSKKIGKARSRKAHALKPQRWVLTIIRRPWLSMVIVGGLILLIFFVIPRLQTGFLPEMDEGAIVLDYATPPGTSLDETDQICREMEKIILSEPEVESYSRRTGTQMGFFITEPNTGDYLIELKKNRKRTTFQVIDDLRRKIEMSQPAVQVDFGQVIGDMLGDLTSSTEPVEIKIFGGDESILNQLAKQVATITESIPGTADVFDGIVIAGPSVQVIPHSAILARYGLSPADIQYQMQAHLEGHIIGSILEPAQLTNIRMIFPDTFHSGVSAIKSESVFLPDGKLTPLEKLAEVKIEPGTAEIQRENLQNMAVVSARLNNRDLGSVMQDLQTAVRKQVFLPKGYQIDYGGQYAEQQQSFKELLTILITASLLVFGVILFFSKDFIDSLIILFIALLGTGGCLLALYVTRTPLNVSSYMGIIMIVGVIGENAIFTLLQFSTTLKTNNVDDALVYAISTRLRPKLMTAIGAIVALLPLALGIGAGALLHQPLAIAVIGGFIFGLPLLLVVFPSLLRIRANGGTMHMERRAYSK